MLCSWWKCCCILIPIDGEEFTWRWPAIKLLFVGANPIMTPRLVRSESYVAPTTISPSRPCCCCRIKLDLTGDSGPSFSGDGGDFASSRFTVVMSCMLDLRLSFPPESCRMKYFCAWLATCVGVLVVTKFREMFLQSPFPYFFNPNKNCLQKNKKSSDF